LNGVKLYSGIDWVDFNGFCPTGNSTGVEGIYFSFPQYSGSAEYTGVNIENKITGISIRPQSSIFYRNGIREDIDNVIHHASVSDLILDYKINDINDIISEFANGKNLRL
jgi:hypothetical protein